MGGPDQPPRKVYVDNVPVSIVAERIEHLDAQGRLVTESLRDFTKRTVRKRFASLDAFLTRWRSAERKQAVIEELEEEGVPIDALLRDVSIHLDPFDVICHVAYDQPPLTRRDRAHNVRRRDVLRSTASRRVPSSRRCSRSTKTKERSVSTIHGSSRSRHSIKWAHRCS